MRFCLTETRTLYTISGANVNTKNGESMKKFLERMKLLQGSRSQREFANSLNIPLNSYTNWFLYDRSPGIDTLFSVCTKLGVSADWLLGLSDDRSPGVAVASDTQTSDLEKKIIRLEGENAALQKALSIVGGHRVQPVKTGGASATKTA